MDRLSGPNALAVGMRHFECTDTSRIDRQENRPRRFMVSAFYPALPGEAAAPVSVADVFAPDLDKGLEALARWHKRPVPPQAASRAQSLRFDARQNLEPAVAAGPFPVLICSAPGEGTRFALASTCIQLAKAGFVVLSLDHPHDAKVVTYPDGAICDSPLADESHMLMRILDVVCLVKHISTPSRPRFLDGLLDLARLGAFGHSRGGATAIASAFWIEEIRAGINLDGYLFGFEPKELCGLEHYKEDFRKEVRQREKPILRLLGVPATSGDLSPFSFEAESAVFGGPFLHFKLPGWAHADFSCDHLSCLVKGEEIHHSEARSETLAHVIRLFFGRMLANFSDLEWITDIRRSHPDWIVGVKPFRASTPA